jgi:hypothetical protein
MGMRAVLGESFLDGFTMAGFMNRIDQPGSATPLCAPTPMKLSLPVLFERAMANADGAGEVLLNKISEETLHAMMDLLQREDEARKRSRNLPEGALHGITR